MHRKTPATLTCTLVEYLYLAALLGGHTLVGTPDPFTGWLAREVEEALRQARTSLEGRSVVRQNPDGSWSVDPDWEQLISAAVSPVLTVVVTHQNGRSGIQNHFHIVDGQAVEQTYQPEAGSVSLSPLASPAQVIDRITALTGLDRQGPALLPGGLLPEGNWNLAAEAVRREGPDGAGSVLAASGIPRETASALGAVLAAPVLMGQVLAVAAASAGGTVTGLGYLAGEQGLWMVRRVTEKGQLWVELSPAPGNEVLVEIRRNLERLSMLTGMVSDERLQ